MYRFSRLLPLLLVCLTGCGLVADTIMDNGKRQGPAEKIKNATNQALRDRFITAIGLDASMFQDPQPRDFSETVGTDLPLPKTNVPGELRFYDRAGFNLSAFLQFMRETYSVELAVSTSELEERTGNRITGLRQLHDGIEVFGAYYRVIAGKDGNVHKAFGTVYDNIAVAKAADLYQDEALAPLKAAYPEVEKWVVASQKTDAYAQIPTGTAIIYPGTLYVLPAGIHPDGQHELTVAHHVAGGTPASFEQVFLGAITPGVRHKIDLIRRNDCPHREKIVEREVNTLFHGKQKISVTHNCLPKVPNDLEPHFKTDFGLEHLPSPLNYYALSANPLSDKSHPNFLNIDLKGLRITEKDTLFQGIQCHRQDFSCNSAREKGYLDAYWGLAKSNEFFRKEYGRTDLMTEKDKITVYFGLPETQWLGPLKMMGFHKNAIAMKHIHIVAHEYVHMVSERMAGLTNTGETGAIAESISDILALRIAEYYQVKSPEWEFAPILRDFGLRNFSQPEVHGDPSVYNSKLWKQLMSRKKKADVHQLAGVMNHWCYLLGEGGKGENVEGTPYQVKQIGLSKTVDIIYQALRFYLGPSSNYLQARQATIQAAEDIYGECSQEARAVADAWHAVGVGDPPPTCEDVWLEFFSEPDNGAQVSIYLAEDKEVTVVENDHKITKVINDPLAQRASRWVVSNKVDGSVIKTSLPMPYVVIKPTSEADAFRSLGITLGKQSASDSVWYTAAEFDRDFLVPGASYYTEDSIFVNKYRHPTLANTFFWSAPQLEIPLLAQNWAVRFGMLDPKMSASDNIFRGFLMKMEGPEVNFWLVPHFYKRKNNNPLFSTNAVFVHR